METQAKTFELLPPDYEQVLLKKKRLQRRSAVKEEETPAVNITSLMDILTILLVFLLKSYSTDPMKVETSPELSLPKTNAINTPTATVTVTVTRSAIMVDNKAVVLVKDGVVAGSEKRGGEDGYLIISLGRVLTEELTKQRHLKSAGATITDFGTLTIVMDENTPYRLLTEIMYTAGQSEFEKFKFAAVSEHS